jgi:hypothetical protein
MIGIMDRLLGGGLRSETQLNPDDDRLYRGSGGGLVSNTGRIVSPESAMRVTAVFRCVSILSQTLASLPLHVFKRLGPGGGKDRAVQNPLYYVLHDRPNGWQTSFDFRAMLMAHLCLRGNAYAEILPGARGAVDQLIPLHPDRVTPEVMKVDNSYRMRYRVAEFGTGAVRILTQDEVLHIRGLSSDGFVGVSPIAAAREAVGLSLATEEHGARTFGNGARPGGVLTSDKPLSPDAKVRLKDSWNQTQSGLENAGKTAVLSDGLKWQQIGMTKRGQPVPRHPQIPGRGDRAAVRHPAAPADGDRQVDQLGHGDRAADAWVCHLHAPALAGGVGAGDQPGSDPGAADLFRRVLGRCADARRLGGALRLLCRDGAERPAVAQRNPRPRGPQCPRGRRPVPDPAQHERRRTRSAASTARRWGDRAMNRYRLIVAEFGRTPLMLLPEKARQIADFLALKAQGADFTPEQVEARIGRPLGPRAGELLR